MRPDPPRAARPARRTPAAFTLVEMLTVISIISVLAGLLLPTLFRARAQARLARCTHALGQIAQGVIAYANSSGDVIPLGETPNLATEALFAKDANYNGPTGLGLLYPLHLDDPQVFYEGESSHAGAQRKIPSNAPVPGFQDFDHFQRGRSGDSGNWEIAGQYFYSQGGHGRNPRLGRGAANRVIIMGWQGITLAGDQWWSNHGGEGTHLVKMDGSVRWVQFDNEGNGIRQFNALDPDTAFTNADRP